MRKSNYLFFLGFLGFIGFRGINDNSLYYLFFIYGGFFSHFWLSKLKQVKSEYLPYNKNKPFSLTFGICFLIAFIISMAIKLSSLDSGTSFDMQILNISVMSAIAINLKAFLTYKFSLNG